jgi:ABC-2 type transport system ATP-binding protein
MDERSLNGCLMNSSIIEISNLSKYYGRSRGIEDVNLSVSQGEIFGFIGPNGAGKSTTIRILLNLIFPTSGSARLLGMDVIKESKKIKSLIGYIPSDANLYGKMSVYEFLSYCIRFYKFKNGEDKIHELAELFELDLQRRISELSLGNKKKVSIIQSLIHNPRLLILDEPTTGLDPLMQVKFFDLLRSENKKGTTIFFSSHVLSEVQALCKKLAIIKDGKIITVEDIDVLRKNQLKKVNVKFCNEESSVGMLGVKGIEKIETNRGDFQSFMYSGDINELIRALSGNTIDDMMIEEPSLEEIFMHYYK